MIVSGCLLSLVSSLALPWTKAQATWKGILIFKDLELGSVTCRLTDVIWLAVIAAVLAVIGLVGLGWKSKTGVIAMTVSVLLMMIFVAYLVGLSMDAYDILGFYKHLLEKVRDIPYAGTIVGWIEGLIRENVIFSVSLQPGFFLFPSSAALVFGGGLMIKLYRPGFEEANRKADETSAPSDYQAET